MSELIKQAAHFLREGKLVAFPTETVYGLGADAKNPMAVERIFLAKKRPHDHPLIIHMGHLNELEYWAKDISPFAFKLAQTFWPGPLSMILKKQPHVLDVVTGGQDTVGLRMPHHPIAQALLNEFGQGIAAPSANQFTHISPTTAKAVREELGDAVDLILDGGACEVGLESTIIDLSRETPVILRPGMITARAISDVLSTHVDVTDQETPRVRAPGMHHTHYAPTTKTVILKTEQINDFLNHLQPSDLPMVFMRIGHSIDEITREGVIIKEMPHHPTHYAHDLYHTLRSFDTGQYKQIVIEAVPHGIEWDAIRDRIYKASGSGI